MEVQHWGWQMLLLVWVSLRWRVNSNGLEAIVVFMVRLDSRLVEQSSQLFERDAMILND